MTTPTIWQRETAYVVDRYDANVRAAGLSEPWDRLLSEPDTAARGLLLGCLGAVATYMAETGTRAASP